MEARRVHVPRRAPPRRALGLACQLTLWLAQVVSLSLANNNLTSILPLSPYLLASNLPNIRNVSFANNQLSKLRDLDCLSSTVGAARHDKRPKGWKDLAELVLTGNPIVGVGAKEAEYRV